MWNQSTCQPMPLTNGFGVNLGTSCPEAAAPYQVSPKSPDCVFSGDPGVPQQLVVTAEDGTVSQVPNPAWAPDSPAFTTIFLRFPDEATAKACLPELWSDDA